jgi:hypothetical protein
VRRVVCNESAAQRAQSKPFIEAAKEAEADATKEGADSDFKRFDPRKKAPER